MKQIKSMKDLMQEDFTEKVEDVAFYLNKKMSCDGTSRFFFSRTKRILSKLTGEPTGCMDRIRHLVRFMLQKLGEMHPDYAYSKIEIQAICNASLFHDVGKFFLPQDVLDKPDKLLPDEIKLMHRHTEYGYELVSRLKAIGNGPYARYVSEICRYHHERFDGNGYPFGLSGDQIPIYVQVVSLIDVYDALISRRDYKPTYTHCAAVEMIESGECGVFNPALLECFHQVADQLHLEAQHYRTTVNYKQALVYRSLKRLNLVMSVGLVSVVAMIGVNIGIFASNLNTSVKDDKLEQLETATYNNANTWIDKLLSDVSLLTIEGMRTISPQPVDPILDETAYEKYANDIVSERGYRSFALYFREGAVYSGEKTLKHLTFESLLPAVNNMQSVLKQDAIISLCNLNFDDAGNIGTEELNGFYICVPIFNPGSIHFTRDKVKGFVVCVYSSTDVASQVSFTGLSDKNSAHIFINDGTYVMKPDNIVNTNNFYAYASENYKFLGNTNLDKLKSELSRYNSCLVNYESNEAKYYASCVPLTQNMVKQKNITGLQNWRVFASVNESVVTDFVNSVQNSSVIFFVVIGVCLMGLIVLISVKLAQVLRITREMAMMNDEIRQNLETSETKYKTILAQTKHLVFEFDHSSHIVTHMEATATRYGFPMVYKYDVSAPAIKGRVHPDDYVAYQKMYHDILLGRELAEANVRLKVVNGGGYIWNRCTMRNIYDEEKRPVRAIGFAEDVNSILAETQRLRDTAMRDAFTGAYNKAYTEILVDKELQATLPDSCLIHAFIIMDVDKFKIINDTFGHAVGDTILKDFTNVLNCYARGYDLVGRVGGDEFVLFMHGIRDHDAAITKAAAIIERAHGVGGEDMNCSISMGIAFAPADGTTYQELFVKADQALYEAKKKGGDGWAICGESV